MKHHVQKIVEGEYSCPYDHPSPVILDIGANIGAFAAWAALRWPGSIIHCYEPLPDNFELLRTNTAFLGNRVVLTQCAVGDPAHDKLFLGKHNCGEASFYQLGEQIPDWVPVTTCHPSTLPKGQILKVDTEGAELEILSGLEEIDFDVILLEYHSEDNRRAIDGLLQNYWLVGGFIRHLARGVLKYIHQRLLPRSGQITFGLAQDGVVRPNKPLTD
jgi:FkbM family methyltransferase